ncbi:MAG: helix-turn-helix domain-containing protein [Terriglobales bacterium]
MEQLEKRSSFLSVGEVAGILGFHPETVRDYARTGVIPALRAGYRWKFDPRTFAAWLRNRQM